MIAVIFEALVREGAQKDYLAAADVLRPHLLQMDGFLSIERFVGRQAAMRRCTHSPTGSTWIAPRAPSSDSNRAATSAWASTSPSPSPHRPYVTFSAADCR